MKKNDVLKGVCIDYTHEGLGVVEHDGFIFFVKNVLKGETINFIVTKLKKNYGYGKCIEVLVPSCNRSVPFCPYFQKCGGCQLQHMTIEEQLRFKRGIVKNNMERIGNIQAPIYDVIGMTQPIAYRNKAQFPLSLSDGVKVGFYRMFSNDIIDMNTCMIQSNLINEIMQFIKNYLKKSSFDDVFRHLLIKHGFATNEVMIVFIVKKKEIDGLDDLVNKIVKRFSTVKSIILNVNERNDNVILGEKEYLLYGKEHIMDELNELKFLISSKSFYQVNPIQTKVLYEKALEFANITKDDTVIDLYCGVGTISLFVARHAKHVVGIEIVEEAIKDAKKNAQLNHIENIEFVCSDAGEYAAYLAKNNMHPDVVIIDPPRKGCDHKTIDSILTMRPKKVVYVSCNPATLARDLKLFEEHQYIAKKIQPVDLFPHSYHVENVCLLQR